MKPFILNIILAINFPFCFSQHFEVSESESKVKLVTISNTPNTTENNKLSDKPFIHILHPSIDKSNNNNPVINNIKILNIKGITYTKDGSGIKNVFINNNITDLDDNDSFDDVVFLEPGMNNIILKSQSNNGSVCIDTIVVNYVKPDSKYFVLHIAISKYKNWPDLINPVANANLLNNVLVNRYGFNKNNIYNLYDDEATVENIYEKFQYLIETVTSNDKLIIIFSGHGHYDNKLLEGYWVTYEARKNKISDYITNSEIVNFIKAIDSKHTLLIADACFAGSMLELALRGKGDINYENFEKRRSRWVFTSGRIEKVEDKSLFTEQIIKILEENNRPQILFTDISEQVIEAVSANSDQMPVCAPIKYANHEGGQFIFHLNVPENF